MHSITEGAAYIQSHIHEIVNPLPPMEPVDHKQPITGENAERPFRESNLQEPAHQESKQHLGEYLEGALPVQAERQTSSMALEPAGRDNIEAGFMCTTQSLQQENRPEVLDLAIIALLPVEARLEFQRFSSVPEPENPNTVYADAVVGMLGVDVDNEVNFATPIVNQINNDETLTDDNMPSYDSNGYDSDGYNSDGYDCDGYDSDGYDSSGYDSDGYDSDGYDSDGYDCDGYDSDGYDCDGYDCDGYDSDGYDGSGYDSDGYDSDGYDSSGYDCDGYDSDGYDSNGYDSDGYDSSGYDSSGNSN